MSKLLPTIASYIPPAVIDAVLLNPVVPDAPMAERFPAATLFADVSGFTPLTEALGQKGAEGPEELTRLLNAYFGRMITLIEAEGGEVVKFGGDAVTVMFPAKDEPLSYAVRRARQTADLMQAAMADFATLQTSVGPVALGMKIGIGAGEVLAMKAGGVRGHWEYVIAGDPLRQVSEAEGRAKRGEIVLSPEAAAVIHPDPLPSRPLAPVDWSAVPDPDAVAAGLRCYVVAPVLAWLDEGLYDWLAVLRPMSVMFIKVTGLDYAQDDIVDLFHGFLRTVQATIDRYEGVISRLSIGDKGTVFLVLFGAPPFSHEDDSIRVVRCALELQAVTQATYGGVTLGPPLQLALGVTTGRVFAGPVGGETRREYTVMGDTANLAARLMSRASKADVAGPGGILCDSDTYRHAQDEISFESLLPMRVKGKVGPIWVYRPIEAVVPAPPTMESRQRALVGRQEELALLEEALAAVEAGESRVLIVEGKAGIGKTRLLAELSRMARERGLTVLQGAGRSTQQQAPYRAWRDILPSCFGLSEISGLAERQARVQAVVRDLAPDQLQRLPLLNNVLDLELPDNEHTAALDPALRKQSLIALLLTLLRAWARDHPLIVVLEDAQWLDSLSWDLAVYLARSLSVSGDPLLLVLVMRPFDEYNIGAQYLATLHLLVDADILYLEELSPEETVALATDRLGLPEGGLPEPVADLVRQRAGGNPFFAEELVLNLRDRGIIRIEVDPARGRDAARGVGAHRPYRCLIVGDLAEASQSLPETVQGLLLDRIDRLPPERQMVLKVSSAIGRTFAFRTFSHVLREHLDVTDAALRTHLDALTILDLVPLDGPDELTFIFSNIITREVAYETLLFAQRRQLHRAVAEWYEQAYGDQLAAEGRPVVRALYPLLAYHYRYAQDPERERRYARLAGEQAAAQFANVEAVAYLSRALELTPLSDPAERRALLETRAKVYAAMGEREAQAQDEAALKGLG